MSGSVVRRLSNEAVSCRIAARGSSSMGPGLCLLVGVPQSQSTWMVKPAKTQRDRPVTCMFLLRPDHSRQGRGTSRQCAGRKHGLPYAEVPVATCYAIEKD